VPVSLSPNVLSQHLLNSMNTPYAELSDALLSHRSNQVSHGLML